MYVVIYYQTANNNINSEVGDDDTLSFYFHLSDWIFLKTIIPIYYLFHTLSNESTKQFCYNALDRNNELIQ